jgi:hypothetical protein
MAEAVKKKERREQKANIGLETIAFQEDRYLLIFRGPSYLICNLFLFVHPHHPIIAI